MRTVTVVSRDFGEREISQGWRFRDGWFVRVCGVARVVTLQAFGISVGQRLNDLLVWARWTLLLQVKRLGLLIWGFCDEVFIAGGGAVSGWYAWCRKVGEMSSALGWVYRAWIYREVGLFTFRSRVWRWHLWEMEVCFWVTFFRQLGTVAIWLCRCKHRFGLNLGATHTTFLSGKQLSCLVSHWSQPLSHTMHHDCDR